jgi:muramoyltetrapeptide carboxypeptidase
MEKRISQLKTGARIGVVAPSGIYDAKRLEESVRLLQDWGFECVMGPNLGKTHRYLAGTDAERLHDLQWALSSPDLHAVWAARGGYGLNRILSGLDLKAGDDRPVIGFSDVSSLHVARYQLGGKSGVHGPVLHSLVDHPSQASRDHLRELLMGSHAFSLQGEIWRGGGAAGPVVGGNLCMLASLCGTPWQLRAQGCILLIEDIGEPPYRVDRMLQQLLSTGCLEGVVGVAVGQFSGFTLPSGAEWGLKDLICETVDVPVIGGLPVGHGPENHAFIYGARASFDGDSLVFGPSAE